MIRTGLYIAFLVLSLLWAMIALLKFDLMLGFEIGKRITGALVGQGIAESVLSTIGWTCLAVTAMFYLAGLYNIFANAEREPWRTILFTTSLLITTVGLGFFELQSMGLIEGSSLYLIALMVLPFTPALIILPFRVTFKEYLSGKRHSKIEGTA